MPCLLEDWHRVEPVETQLHHLLRINASSLFPGSEPNHMKQGIFLSVVRHNRRPRAADLKELTF